MAIIKMNFLSQALGMQTNVTICLPSFSFKDVMEKRDDVYVPGMKYQVMWLLHGGGGDELDYLHFSNITRYADDHKLAVVMPADYNMYYADYDHGKYQTFISEELPKMCRAIFPFSDKREDNIIAGLSMGSIGAQKIAVAHPEQYAACLAMSGGAFVPLEAIPPHSKVHFEGAMIEETIALADEKLRNGVSFPEFYMLYGDKDFTNRGHHESCEWLRTRGVKVYEEEIPGYGHEWDLWDLTLRKAINELLPLKHAVIYPQK